MAGDGRDGGKEWPLFYGLFVNLTLLSCPEGSPPPGTVWGA